MRGGPTLVLVAAVVLFVGAGCKQRSSAQLDGVAALEFEETTTPVPEDADAFLRALLPQPHAQLHVTYAVEGAGGTTGALEVWIAEGGLRKEAWTVRFGQMAPSDAPMLRTVSGVMVQTPTTMYERVGDAPAMQVEVPLRELGEAWMALPVARRRAAFTELARWYADRDRAIAASQTPSRTVAGHTCAVRRVAGQSLCVWEAAGLLLAYQGEAFTIEATQVEIAEAVDPTIFTAPSLDGTGPVGVDPRFPSAGTMLAALEAGDMELLSPLLHPGLRVTGSLPAQD